jgi:ActR/RegA family two-component response regulator
MTPLEKPIAHRVLLVDDDEAVRDMMTALLSLKGFDVAPAASVTEALRFMATETFDVLITDLHMSNPGDGFTVISAMRHSQPHALALLVSGYPNVKSAMDAVALEADEITVKPLEIQGIPDLIRKRLLTRKPVARLAKERVEAVLQRCIPSVIENWLARVKQAEELNHILLSEHARTGHLHKLLEDLIVRLRKSSATTKDSDAASSDTAIAHGKLRYMQCYTPAMLVHESRLLQVILFGTLHRNLGVLDFSLLLPDVMTIADEVDAQLTQSMKSYMNEMHKGATA